MQSVCKERRPLKKKKKIEAVQSIREQAKQLSYCKLNHIATVCGFRFVLGATLDARHHRVLSCVTLWCITRIFQKPVGNKVKTSFRQREAFSAILWSSSSDETAATAACTLVFERLAAVAFVTTLRRLIDFGKHFILELGNMDVQDFSALSFLDRTRRVSRELAVATS